jgi:hypothetical protein
VRRPSLTATTDSVRFHVCADSSPGTRRKTSFVQLALLLDPAPLIVEPISVPNVVSSGARPTCDVRVDGSQSYLSVSVHL